MKERVGGKIRRRSEELIRSGGEVEAREPVENLRPPQYRRRSEELIRSGGEDEARELVENLRPSQYRLTSWRRCDLCHGCRCLLLLRGPLRHPSLNLSPPFLYEGE